MTITFFSNFLLLHQTPFCEAMVRLLGEGFHYVATERIPQERLAMGYEDLSHSADYAVNSYESDAAYQEAIRLGVKSDVVIIGSAPDVFIEQRLKDNKLTFRYSERYFKQGRWRILDPRVLRSRLKHDFRYRHKPLYMLCASAYTAPDCHFILSYPGKTYRWGYFPDVRKYDEEQLMAGKHNTLTETIEILWVARFLKLKHPEFPIKLAEHLRKNDINFHLTMIGEGECRKSIETMIDKNRLADYVTLLNFMPHEQVRKHMESANIFLFTSNKEEGWGAVLNEAMNSGCAVVANDEIGSVPFLIKPGENGLTYHKTISDMCNAVDSLISHPEKIRALGLEAYRTIRSVWNADTASSRFLQLIESINTGRPLNIDYGPISKA